MYFTVKYQSMATISAILPTLNEEENIVRLITQLQSQAGESLIEIIVVDGWSKDHTVSLATQLWVTVLNSKPWRARQMNLGAKHATGSIVWFIHLDTRLGEWSVQEISQKYDTWTYGWCFQTHWCYEDWTPIKSNWRLHRTTTWTTWYHHWIFRMWGQTLRVDREDFQKLWGYDETLLLCEEVDLYRKIYKLYNNKFYVSKNTALVSRRKHDDNGALRMTMIYIWIYAMFWLWVSQKTMMKRYIARTKSKSLANYEEYIT